MRRSPLIYASSSTLLVTVGLYVIPFAGIAFLWHAHCTRLLIETRTPSPSAIPYGLQLVSGDVSSWCCCLPARHRLGRWRC